MLNRHLTFTKWKNPFTGTGSERVEDEPEGEAPIPGVMSPQGFYPLNDQNDPARAFNFWLMDANFELGTGEVQAASSVPGVEGWDTYSRYRARLAFARQFRPRDVMSGIRRVLGCGVSKTSQKLAFCLLKRQLRRNYEHWAIRVRPNGSLNAYYGELDDVKGAVAGEAERGGRVRKSW